MKRDAALSADGTYRYWLTRQWQEEPNVPIDLWVMLNPSTADASIDDPTIRRCINFSRDWGAGGLRVVNLFALRATDPKTLVAHPDPIGPENDVVLGMSAATSHTVGGRIIAAWGAHAMAERRAQRAVQLLGRGVKCLGVTKSGAPKHPLYVKGDTEPVSFWGAL